MVTRYQYYHYTVGDDDIRRHIFLILPRSMILADRMVASLPEEWTISETMVCNEYSGDDALEKQ